MTLFNHVNDQVPLESNDIVPNYEQHMTGLMTVAHSDLFYGVGKLSHRKDTRIVGLTTKYPKKETIPTIRTSFPRVNEIMPPW